MKFQYEETRPIGAVEKARKIINDRMARIRNTEDRVQGTEY